MPSLTADLKWVRQQLEAAQVEVAGRQTIGAMVIWDEQNESSVNQIPESFSGLIVHLTPELSPPVGTEDGISDDAYAALKAHLLRELSR
jgi:hypothetical protein